MMDTPGILPRILPRLAPQPGPQYAFLAAPADIAIYGGAAGGGKSWALLYEPLRHVQKPGFGAVIFRRTYPQIRNQGGLWDESRQIYPQTGGVARDSFLEWRWAAGGAVKFAHMQYDNDAYNWQGAQIPLLCFDELTHFSAFQFFYMLSRNRSVCGVRPYVRATCNPDATSWVAEFLAWWIDQETGYPIPQRSGALRWFLRVGDEIVWAGSPQELALGHPQIPAKSVTFIPARVQDNRILLEKDPGYLANLLALPLVERERLLGGNWKIRAAAGKVFNRAWFQVVEAAPSGGREVRFWDLAASEKKLGKRDPDYTVGVKLREIRTAPEEARWYIVDVAAVQAGPVEVDTLMRNLASQDGRGCAVRWEIEGGASGKRDSARLARMLGGYDARGIAPEGDKLVRAKPLAAQVEAGNVLLLRGAWNERFLAELHAQPEAPHDDQMDAASGAFNYLTATAGGESVVITPRLFDW